MLIIDTGVLVAATDRTDPAHAACVELLTGETEPLVTTGVAVIWRMASRPTGVELLQHRLQEILPAADVAREQGCKSQQRQTF